MAHFSHRLLNKTKIRNYCKHLVKLPGGSTWSWKMLFRYDLLGSLRKYTHTHRIVDPQCRVFFFHSVLQSIARNAGISKPFSPTGIEPVTDGCLVIPATVHRSANWATPRSWCAARHAHHPQTQHHAQLNVSTKDKILCYSIVLLLSSSNMSISVRLKTLVTVVFAVRIFSHPTGSGFKNQTQRLSIDLLLRHCCARGLDLLQPWKGLSTLHTRTVDS